MIVLYTVAAWLIGGVLFTIFVGRTTDAFDYSPSRGQVSPATFKYAMLVIWPIIAIHWILQGLWDLTGWFFKALDRGYDRLIGRS